MQQPAIFFKNKSFLLGLLFFFLCFYTQAQDHDFEGMWRGLLSQEGKDHKDIFILKLYAETDSTLFGTSKIVSNTGEYSEFYIEGTYDSTHVCFQDMQLIKNDGNAYLYKDCIKDFFSNVSFDGKKWVMTGTWNQHPNDSIPPSSTCTKGKYYLTKVLTYTDKVQEDKEKIRYFQGRLIEIQNSFEVDSDTLTLCMIDDNQIDNDTVTIFFDKKLIVKKLGLSYECYDFDIVLDDDHEHLLVIYANNVGEMPPNTAAISFVDNGKKRELSIRSDMSKSSGIIFKKKKKNK